MEQSTFAVSFLFMIFLKLNLNSIKLNWIKTELFGGLVYFIRDDGKTQPEQNRLQYNFSVCIWC